MFLYSIFNYKTNSYHEPCFFPSDVTALSWFRHFFTSTKFPFVPDDVDNYELRCLGYFNLENGEIDMDDNYVVSAFKDILNDVLNLLKEEDND